MRKRSAVIVGIIENKKTLKMSRSAAPSHHCDECSCISCYMRNQRLERLTNGAPWCDILRLEASNPVLSHLLRPSDLFVVDLANNHLSVVTHIQRSWRALQEIRKGVCMDCGSSFKDFRFCPNAKTHDGFPRCGSCEKCYGEIESRSF